MRKSVIISLLIATSVYFAGCTTVATEVEEAIDNSVPVHVVKVGTGTIQETYFGIGSLQAEKEFDVLSEQTGTVKNIFVQVGDVVEKGQVLMEIDNETLHRDVQNTESNLKTQLNSAALTLQVAEETYAQTMALYSTGAVSENDVKTVTTALNQARLTYSNANTNYNLTLQNENDKLSDVYIKSPIAGVVAASYVKIGQEITSEVVFKVINSEKMTATIEVTSDAVRKLEVGSESVIYPEGNRNNQIMGTVTRINEVTGQKSFMFPVEIEIENDNNHLRSGDYVESKIILEERQNRVVIPKHAVLNILTTPQVYVSNNEIAELREVKLGYINGEEVEVVSGLSVGDNLVVQGHDFLEAGLPLRITEEY